MADVISLPDNPIGPPDRERLEAFMGHEIGRGRATRWAWTSDQEGNHLIELYSGGANEALMLRVGRDREKDAFQAFDAEGTLLVEGSLDHVMAELDTLLAHMHGERLD
jgi:hypothetical protein